jgi:murein DD-endopeptidase MepM/ murein hydrolase activator NlpD
VVHRSATQVSARVLAALTVLVTAFAGTGLASAADRVSSEGYLLSATPALTRTTEGGLTLRTIPVEVGFDQFRADVEVTAADGTVHRVRGLRGNGFFVSDLGRVIVLETAESSAYPSALRVYDLSGALDWECPLDAPANPVQSPSGRYLACAVRDGSVVLDFASHTITRAPHLDLLAVANDGMLAGISYRDDGALLVQAMGADARRVTVSAPARRVDVAADGGSAFVLTASELREFPMATADGTPAPGRRIFLAPAGAELQDFRRAADGFEVGLRYVDGSGSRGELVTLARDGSITGGEAGPAGPRNQGEVQRDGTRGIPWPIAPNSQHPVGNTYGEYQNYGGAPYPHPGFDVMGNPNQAVFAVRRGVVKAILTTSAEYHWRVAIADTSLAATGPGYLYAHLNQASITVHVGDVVQVGQQIGTLVPWPNDNFTHCHFTRIEDSGATWDGQWLSIANPHLDVPSTETAAPVFLQARPGSLLAFCTNQTSSYQAPTALHGAVDIVARIYDQIATTWKCTVQEIRYTIYPLGHPNTPVVNNKQSVFFSFNLDTYMNGTLDAFMISLLYKQDSTCQTQGDYTNREFYHIITNSNGDQVYDTADLNEAWNTALLPDGNYVVRVKAIDAAGNAKSDSMTVTTVNGNPSGVDTPPALAPELTCRPNPAVGGTALSFTMPAPGAADLAIYGPDGRLVRTILGERLPAGPASGSWDLRDARGLRVPAGTYFYRLEALGRSRAGSVIVVR